MGARARFRILPPTCDDDMQKALPRSALACRCGGDVRKFEPKTWLKFKDLDKSIRELRAMFKQHPHWFEVPTLKSSLQKPFQPGPRSMHLFLAQNTPQLIQQNDLLGCCGDECARAEGVGEPRSVPRGGEQRASETLRTDGSQK